MSARFFVRQILKRERNIVYRTARNASADLKKY